MNGCWASGSIATALPCSSWSAAPNCATHESAALKPSGSVDSANASMFPEANSCVEWLPSTIEPGNEPTAATRVSVTAMLLTTTSVLDSDGSPTCINQVSPPEYAKLSNLSFMT